MFEQLSDRLQSTLSDVRSRGKLSEADIDSAMRDIRLALLEADVNFKVVKAFTKTLKERCLGAEVMDSLDPGQQVVKIVNEELAKVRRVIAKLIPDAPHETLISIDATTGQNGLRQAKVFSEAVQVDGVVITKLDGTAKGGIALAIASELGIPVKLIGVGEKLEDLRPFDPAEYAAALLAE